MTDRRPGGTTRVARIVRAPRSEIYRAFLDPDRVALWLPPRGMRGVVHEFESEQEEMSGTMHVTWTLADTDGGTEVSVVCEGIPPGIRPEDNEAGSASSLENLARLVETQDKP